MSDRLTAAQAKSLKLTDELVAQTGSSAGTKSQGAVSQAQSHMLSAIASLKEATSLQNTGKSRLVNALSCLGPRALPDASTTTQATAITTAPGPSQRATPAMTPMARDDNA